MAADQASAASAASVKCFKPGVWKVASQGTVPMATSMSCMPRIYDWLCTVLCSLRWNMTMKHVSSLCTIMVLAEVEPASQKRLSFCPILSID